MTLKTCLGAVALLLNTATLAEAQTQVTDEFIGQGQILVLNSTSYSTATAADSIGCVSTSGALTVSDCGQFTRSDVSPYLLSTSQGSCSFKNQLQPVNSDSVYGESDHAWSCWAGNAGSVSDQLYTINGFPLPFLCYGDVDCYFDVNKAPEGDEELPIWPFRWGSRQRDITPGHLKVMFLWEKL